MVAIFEVYPINYYLNRTERVRFQKSQTFLHRHGGCTSMGTIVFEMYYDHAPRTCKNLVELVCLTIWRSLAIMQSKRGYYNGVVV